MIAMMVVMNQGFNLRIVDSIAPILRILAC